MKFHILTLFPEMFGSVLHDSMLGRAEKKNIIEFNVINIRDFACNKHNRVDDYPYGGGRGMVMQAEPIYKAYQSICESLTEKPHVIYMSPKGKVFSQGKAVEFASYDNLVILCGHYEGVDQRIIDEIVDEELSIGDYVLTGGEIPACVVVDCVARLCDGVLSDAECFEKESFSDNMLEYPQYTRPYDFMGRVVPDVLLSGHHMNIDKWREEKAREITQERRPDLLQTKE